MNETDTRIAADQPSSAKTLTNHIVSIINGSRQRPKKSIIGISIILTILILSSVILTIANGLGLWNITQNIPWGITICNFVYWIGLAHAGTLISAILYLFNQEWRVSIHRLAETMTLIAVAIGGLFPWIHTGRPWFALYWLLPYPNQMGIWPNFKSPLIWDYIAILSYFIVSVIFWYLGLMPDFSMLKSKIRNRFVSKSYDFLSLGWNGSTNQLKSYYISYGIIAGLATALVISVHTIVSFDFAVTIMPGWHSLIFPLYFVAGAIFSGLAAVVLLSLFVRRYYYLHEYISNEQLAKLAKIMIATGIFIGYCYLMEIFSVFYSGNALEMADLLIKTSNGGLMILMSMICLNVLLPQLLWVKDVRENPIWLGLISVFVLVGMWLERYFIVILSQKGWVFTGNTSYFPSIYEIIIFAGSFGLFFGIYLLIFRFIPIIPVFESIVKIRK